MRNTTHYQKVLGLILVVLCATAFLCYAIKKHEYARADLQNSIVLNDNWLINPACLSPCWNGIYPGKSTLLQSLNILLKANSVENIIIKKYIDWGLVEWKETSSGNVGRLFYDGRDSKVYAIEPHFNCCSTLKDVINVYGEPSHVIVLALQIFEDPNVGDWIYSYRIVWLDIGMEVGGYPSIENKIDKDFNISSIAYFEPNKNGLLKYEGRIVDLMVDWKGYNDRSVYLIEK